MMVEPRDQSTQPADAAVGAPTQEEMAELRARLDDAVAARQRALADFANYQRRADESAGRARVDTTAAVLRSLIPVLDQFDLALSHHATRASADQLARGMKLVRAELAKALEAHGLSEIPVAVGDELDPHRHEAIMRRPAEGVEPNHVSAVLHKGYMLGEQVLRPAKVAVAPSDEET